MPETLPYRLACLCDLRDAGGRVLLLRRNKAPNKGLCSPIGGKLEMPIGESPAQCAQREIKEETGLDIPIERLHLMGMISEAGYEGEGHWLLFYYRVLGAVEHPGGGMNEGVLEWHRLDEIGALPLPETDREIIWPMVAKHEAPSADHDPGFFAVHIDCTGGDLRWWIEEEKPASR